MRTQTIDRILLGAALAAAVASFVWFGWAVSTAGRVHRAVTPGASLPAATSAQADAGSPAGRMEPWQPPSTQSRGPRWVYDLFTPPSISYDAQTGQFDVTPPLDPARENGSAAPPGVELIAVRRDPFRLQLVGYVGGEGAFLGTFEDLATGEVFLAGPGRQLPGLGLEIAEFTVQRRPVPIGDGTTSKQRVATAVVRDTRTGRITTLTADERAYTEELCAVLSSDEDGDEFTREVHRGDVFQSSDRTYRIKRLQLDPSAVEFSQISPASSQLLRLGLSRKVAMDPPPAPPSN